MKTWTAALSFSLLLAFNGCADEEDDPYEPPDDERASTLNPTLIGWGCRDCGYTNSPMLGTHAIEQFRTGSTAGDGLLLVGIEEPNGTVRSVQVVDDAFVATKNGQNYSGSQIVGWKLRFETPTKTIVKAKIYTYQTHPDWVAGTLVDTYSLAYWDANGDVDVNICPGLNLDETSVVLIPGETYDLGSLTVEPYQSGWVTVACRGHSLAKMKLLGYDPADQYGSKWEERQATVKMLTADYCGIGHSFTQVGQPIDWRDVAGHFPITGNEDKSLLEAKWTLDGATCLDTPRLAPIADVEQFCKLPKCNAELSWGDATWMSFRR